MQAGDILQARNARHPRDGFDELVRSEIDDVEDSRTEVRGKQVMIFVVGGEIVEALSFRSRELYRHDLSQTLRPETTRQADECGCNQNQSVHCQGFRMCIEGDLASFLAIRVEKPKRTVAISDDDPAAARVIADVVGVP